MTPLIAIVKNLLAKIQGKVESLSDKPITSIVNGLIATLEADNHNLRNMNKETEIQIAALKSRHAKNTKYIKDRMKKLLDPNAKTTQQVLDPVSNVKNNNQ